MLMLELMAEAARRYGSGPGWSAVIGDAGDQSRHGMDAPDTVQDGMEWFADDDDPEVCGPVPRLVELREAPNVGIEPPYSVGSNDGLAGARRLPAKRKDRRWTALAWKCRATSATNKCGR